MNIKQRYLINIESKEKKTFTLITNGEEMNKY